MRLLYPLPFVCMSVCLARMRLRRLACVFLVCMRACVRGCGNGERGWAGIFTIVVCFVPCFLPMCACEFVCCLLWIVFCSPWLSAYFRAAGLAVFSLWMLVCLCIAGLASMNMYALVSTLVTRASPFVFRLIPRARTHTYWNAGTFNDRSLALALGVPRVVRSLFQVFRYLYYILR